MKSHVRIFAICTAVLALAASNGLAKKIEKDSKQASKATVVTKKADNIATSQSSTQTSTTDTKATTSPATATSTGNTDVGLTNTLTGEQINWQVLSGGGVINATSASYMLSGTVGQTATGPSSSSSYNLNAGFWQNFAASGGCCVGNRGNIDNDPSDAVDIADLVYLVEYSFSGGPAPVCFEEADVNGDMSVDIADLVYLVEYSFSGGPAPIACP